VDKSHALINGIIQEYDVCLNSLDPLYTSKYTEYTFIGQDIIIDVNGIKSHGNSQKYFYREKIKKEKRSSW